MAGATSFTYTPFNMAETATTGGATTRYEYDAEQQRRRRVAADGTVTFFIAGPNYEPLAEYTITNGAPAVQREYVYLGDRLLASVEAPTQVS